MNNLKVYSDNNTYDVELEKDLNSGVINEKGFDWDVLQIKDNSFSVIKDNKSYNVELLSVNKDEKRFFIKVNGLKYKLNIKDKYDELLHSLGMDNLISQKVGDLKAPMPGLVLDVSVLEGEEVKKGDTLLILEAMKMENVIKSPTDGVVKKISIKKGEAVEKNQLILNFE
ncbi:MAG: biotin/lipoyl-binding protein [Vicingus serpentipes]|nr:biotin/lipoyl-binding protein [Vicingus serpentipes]